MAKPFEFSELEMSWMFSFHSKHTEHPVAFTQPLKERAADYRFRLQLKERLDFGECIIK